MPRPEGEERESTRWRFFADAEESTEALAESLDDLLEDTVPKRPAAIQTFEYVASRGADLDALRAGVDAGAADIPAALLKRNDKRFVDTTRDLQAQLQRKAADAAKLQSWYEGRLRYIDKRLDAWRATSDAKAANDAAAAKDTEAPSDGKAADDAEAANDAANDAKETEARELEAERPRTVEGIDTARAETGKWHMLSEKARLEHRRRSEEMWQRYLGKFPTARERLTLTAAEEAEPCATCGRKEVVEAASLAELVAATERLSLLVRPGPVY